MKVCNCNIYGDILEYTQLKDRFKDTKKILSDLKLLAQHPEKEHQLYQCVNCGQYWQKSMSWMDGNKQYVFKVREIEVTEWKEQPFVQPDDLFARTGIVNQYLKRATFEEQETLCRHPSCPHHAIQLSIFCIVHHMESIKIATTIPDNVTWFPPFEKKHLELSYERLSELPNYKKYS
ncbi:hypothetical protein [Ferruginibacter sp.]